MPSCPLKIFYFLFFPSLFSPMIFQNLKNYCILYIYIWCVIVMLKCQWTAVVLLSESTKEQSAQTTDGLDLWALHACPYFLEKTLYRPCTLFSPMIFQNLKNYCTLYIYIYIWTRNQCVYVLHNNSKTKNTTFVWQIFVFF